MNIVKLQARVLACATLLGLASCEQVTQTVNAGLSGLAGIASQNATAGGIRTLALLDGSVRVRGPDGYCIDQSASRARDGFAVMVGCALLSNDAAVMPDLDGLVTVQFGAPDTASVTGNEDAFSAFLRTDQGRRLLSQSGDNGTVTQVETVTDIGAVLARFEDTSGPAFPGTFGAQWRGFVDIQGRLVTVSALSFERGELTRAQGERLLVVALAQLNEVNAQHSPAQQSNVITSQ